MAFDRTKDYVLTDKGDAWLEANIRNKSQKEMVERVQRAKEASSQPSLAGIAWNLYAMILSGIDMGDSIEEALARIDDSLGRTMDEAASRGEGDPERNYLKRYIQSTLDTLVDQGYIAPVEGLPEAFKDFRMYE